MRILISALIIGLFCLTGIAQNEEGIQFTHGKWSEVKAKAKAENKLIFIDCYTSWCGPCKMLSKNVFPQKEVGELFNEHFINFKVDMEKGEGIQLKELFKVAAFPTLVWVDAEGNELHKTVGAPKAEGLLKIAQDVIDGKGMAAMARAYETNKADVKVMKDYLEVLGKAYEKAKIQEVLYDYFTSVKGKQLLKEDNYTLIHTYLTDIYSSAFVWFDKNQASFKDLYGEEEVDKKLFQTYLSFGHDLVSTKDGKRVVDYDGFKKYQKILNKRKVKEREKIDGFVEQGIFRAEANWEMYIAKVNSNIKKGYYGQPNSFLYYNWARAISNDKNAEKEYLMQAVEWMQDAFEASQWPLKNNIVYLDEKLKIMKMAGCKDNIVTKQSDEIKALKQKVAKGE